MIWYGVERRVIAPVCCCGPVLALPRLCACEAALSLSELGAQP